MAATTLLRTAALAAPHPSINPPIRSSLVRLSLITRRQTYPKTHCSTPAHFSHKLLKRHRFVLDSVCFASSGETTETQEVEEQIHESQLEGIDLVWKERRPKIIVESDSRVVVALVHKDTPDHPLNFVLKICGKCK